MKLEVVKTLAGHEDRVWSVGWSHDGRWLASCSSDRSICVWDGAGFGLLCALTDAHERTVRRVAWHPRLARFAAAAFDGTCSVWEPEDRAGRSWICAATLEGHENEVKSAAWDPAGRALATCGRDKAVWVWAVTDDACREFDCAAVLRGHAGDVKVVAFVGSDLLLSGSYDNSVRTWRCPTQQQGDEASEWEASEALQGHASTVWDIAVDGSGSGRRFASASDDSRVLVWERSAGDADEGGWRAQHSLPAAEPGRPVYSVAWSPHAARIATGSGDNTVRVFCCDAASGQWSESARAVADAADVNCVAWSPTDPSLLAAACDDGLVRIFRVVDDA